MNYITSDLHFGHKNIQKMCPGRCNDEAIIKHWNDRVGFKDTVYVLGDFSFGNATVTKSIIKRLNGIKVLIRGNHDNRSDSWYLDAGFHIVSRQWIMRIMDRHSVVLSHYPPKPTILQMVKWLFTDRSLLRYLDRHHGDSYLVVHGHRHGKLGALTKRGLDVSWDLWGKLLTEEDVAKELEKIA